MYKDEQANELKFSTDGFSEKTTGETLHMDKNIAVVLVEMKCIKMH